MHLPADVAHIKCALEKIIPPGQVTELRALYVPTPLGGRTYSGFFDNLEVMAQVAADLSDKGASGVYFTPNPVKRDLLARAPNCATLAKRGALTKDTDIEEVEWLLIDIDPVRESGVAATKEEKAGAATVVKDIHGYLAKENWPAPLLGDSGNGYHLLYRVSHVDPSLIRGVLDALAFIFDTAKAKVDQSVFNPSRIWKLYGTAARKGEHTDNRPHRLAQLLDSPGGILAVPEDKLQALADKVPSKPRSKGAKGDTAKLELYLNKHFPKLHDPEPWHGLGRRWVFDICPWDSAHKDRSAFVVQFDNGAIAAGCLHANCDGNKKDSKGKGVGWKELQKLLGEKFNNSTAIPILASTADSPNLTDLGNAKRLVRSFQHDLLYCANHGSWFVYDDRRWKRDTDGAVVRRAKQTVGTVFAEAAAESDPNRRADLHKHALRSESQRAIQATVSLASTEEEIAIESYRLDQDPWLFNVQNGTLDLKTGQLQDHDRTDFITMISPVVYDPTAACPNWDSFLNYAMDGDQEVIEFIHRFFGYCLTGLVTEQVMLFMEGTGGNGKTTALLILMHVMGDYAKQGAPGLLLDKKNESHPTEVADLEGARFIANAEVEKGKPFAEVLIKQLTGGDPIRARKMRQDFYQFMPTHKLCVAANHKPIIKGNDEGIWRRILRIPWRRKISARDPFFLDKLKVEAPGILAKVVKGCLAWQQDGLRPPSTVRIATEEYREEMDVLSEFLEECCDVGKENAVAKKELYMAYLDWCDSYRQRPSNYSLFNRQMSERDYCTIILKEKVGNTRRSSRKWKGIGIKRVQAHKAPMHNVINVLDWNKKDA